MSEARLLVPRKAASRAQPFGRVPFSFGPRMFVALLLGFVLLVPAWWLPKWIVAMFLWDAMVLALFVADLVRLPHPGQLEASRRWEHAPSLATPSEVTLGVRNFGKISIQCTLVDETPVSFRDAPPSLDLGVAPGQEEEIRYTICPNTRGDARMGELSIHYQSKIGLAERWGAAEISQTVRVLPDLEQARQQALYLIRSRQVEMEKRRRRLRGHGREFESLRDYRQGDDLREVCWTATARRHQLVTRLFEMERSQVVWIALDAGRLLRAEIQQEGNELRLAKLDYAVNAALSLAQVAVQCGDRVGLLAYGHNFQYNVAAGRGPLLLRTIVDCLAQVHGEASEADHARAARILLTEQKRRSLVVWVTDFSETPTTPDVIEQAMQIARRHLVIFAAISQPDLTALAETTPETPEEMYRHAAALEIAQRRDLLLRSLRQRGIFAFELLPGLLTSSLVNQYLDIKERNLL